MKKKKNYKNNIPAKSLYCLVFVLFLEFFEMSSEKEQNFDY